MISGVYQIRHKEQNKRYIGSTADFSSRESKHWLELTRNKHHSAYLQNAYNKHGKEMFVFEKIEEVQVPFLEEREQYWMDTLNPEYNMAKKAYNAFYGFELSPEQQEAKRAALVATYGTEEGRKTQSERAKKGWQNSEQREKRIADRRVFMSTPEQIETQRRRSVGFWQDPDFRQRTSDGIREALNRPGIKEKRSKAIKKSLSSPEVRHKISEGRKKHLQDPEVREKLGAAIRKARNTPEFKSQQSERSKKLWEDPEYRAKHTGPRKKAA